jgi:hypothetical protein
MRVTMPLLRADELSDGGICLANGIRDTDTIIFVVATVPNRRGYEKVANRFGVGGNVRPAQL